MKAVPERASPSGHRPAARNRSVFAVFAAAPPAAVVIAGLAAAGATVALPVPAVSQEEDDVELGYVSHVTGTWLVGGDTVHLYRRIHRGDSLSAIVPSDAAPSGPHPTEAPGAPPSRLAGSEVTPALAIVAMTGQRIRFLCDEASACRRPLVPADSLDRSSGLAAFAARVVHAVGSLIEREKPDLVSTISRGGPEIGEAVVSKRGDAIDLDPVMGDQPAGRYRVELYRLAPGAQAGGGPALSSNIAWDPAAGDSIAAPGVETGLYRIEVSSAVGLFPPESAAWVLVVEAERAGHLQGRFAHAVEITSSWSGDAAEGEVRAFLRMYLWHLAQSETGSGG